MKYKRTISLFFLSCIITFLSGCSQSTMLYRVNVQQGNIITSDMVSQLHVGMTKNQVIDVMGPPVLLDPFNSDRWSYVFMYKPGKGNCAKKHVILYFRNERISHLDSD